MMSTVARLLVLLLLAGCAAGRSAGAAEGGTGGMPGLGAAVPVDEALRREYGRCDRKDAFGGLRFPIRNAAGAVVWYGCRTDPSRLEALLRLPRTEASGEAVLLRSKMALDLDGSWIACNKRGITDQCATSLMLPRTAEQPCVVPGAPAGACVPVDSDRVPYVVLPMSGPRGSPSSGFREGTGIRIGDFGVVIHGGRTVPVIVADGGPFYKVGEGSMALHRALGIEFCAARDAAGHCTATRRGSSIGGDVVTILFPGSAQPGLTPGTIAAVVRERGAALHAGLLRAHPP